MMTIWKKTASVQEINDHGATTLAGHLGMAITEIGEDSLTGTMPVDHRTRQSFGILHGGASVALAETLGSIAGTMSVPDGKRCVGVEINANHIAKVASGYVTGVATPVHLGNRTQVWEIRISNEEGRLTCISRITLAVIERK